jgi:hypothetical protein
MRTGSYLGVMQAKVCQSFEWAVTVPELAMNLFVAPNPAGKRYHLRPDACSTFFTACSRNGPCAFAAFKRLCPLLFRIVRSAP